MIGDVMAAALTPGEVAEPTTLLVALRREAEPLTALMHMSTSGDLFGAIEKDFGFIGYIRLTRQPLGESERTRWAARIRWLICNLPEWTRAGDERLAMLAALLVTAKMCGGSEGIWGALPDDCTPKPELVETTAQLIAGRRIEYGQRGIGPIPIWENEFIERFKQADANGDWAEIAAQWSQLEHAAMPDFVLSELVRCLARYGLGALAQATDALLQTPIVMQIANFLQDGQRLQLALHSGSARVRFCCAHATLIRSPLPTNLASNDEDALYALLVKVAAEADEWRAWMRAFNTYPLRYPALHAALGRALATASREAMRVYIESIGLSALPATKPNMGKSRALIASCLRVFARHALPEQREAMWGCAFQRWCDWRFGEDARQTELLEIHHSELDFAVVSYVFECMSASERDRVIASIRDQLGRIEIVWHPTETKCIAEWNCLLSIFQPYAHATVVASGVDALAETRTYWPFDISKWSYHRIMFRVNAVSLGSGMQS